MALGCTACSCEHGQPAVDSRPDGPDAGADARVPDAGIDISAPDTTHPDLLWPNPDCGGPRVLSPTVVTPHAAKSCGKGCKQVSFGGFADQRYEVAGDTLVYTGDKNAAWQVYVVDLKTGKERMLEPYTKKNEGCALASTDGTTIAYTCSHDIKFVNGVLRSTRRIAVFDRASNNETTLACLSRASTAAAVQCIPSYLTVGPPGIVVNMSLGPCITIDALLYRFTDGKLVNISNKKGGVAHTHMSGSRIVWREEDMAFKAAQVMLYDVKKGTAKRIDPNNGKDQYQPRIEGTQIVWTDHRNGPGGWFGPANSDIYHHDLATGKTIQVTSDKGTQEMADVWGDWVVWMDWRNSPGGLSRGGNADNTDVYAKNLKTGKEVQLTSYPGHELYPRVDQGKVYFIMLDTRNRGSIFVIDLAARL